MEINNNQQHIHLDATVTSSLSWHQDREAAREFVRQGSSLAWNLDLGIWKQVKSPADPMTFQALRLALEHFCQFLWPEFASHTVGVSLYNGAADFSDGFVWDDLQEKDFSAWCQQMPPRLNSRAFYVQNVAVDYLNRLVGPLLEEIPFSLTLDLKDVQDPLTEAFFRLKEGYERFHLIFKGGQLPCQDTAKTGLCFPKWKGYPQLSLDSYTEILQQLIEEKKPFRLMNDERITLDWDGLDLIVYSEQMISPEGKRKLKGFCAAGGKTIALESSK